MVIKESTEINVFSILFKMKPMALTKVAKVLKLNSVETGLGHRILVEMPLAHDLRSDRPRGARGCG